MIKAQLGKQVETVVARLAALNASISRGLADADAGRVKSSGPVFDRLEAKYRGLAPEFAPAFLANRDDD